jgi:hypothetical protein
MSGLSRHHTPRRHTMSRQKLLAVLATVAVLITTACADVTAPRNDGPAPCPVTGGPDCGPH